MLNISSFPWAECAITENRSLYISDSLSLKRTKRSTGNHRYEFELVTNEMPIKQGRSVVAQISRATNDTLTFIHPVLSYSVGTEPASGLRIWSDQYSGDADIPLQSINGTDQWQLFAGDYIQFDNDTKVYQVAEDTELSSSLKIVKLTCPIRYDLSPSSNTAIMNDIEWHLESSGAIETTMVASEGQDIQFTLVAVEKL